MRYLRFIIYKVILMKKLIIVATLVVVSLAVRAQSSFEVKDFGSFKLHVQVTNDPLGDMSSVIEGAESLVIVEPAAFNSSIKEQQMYIDALGKRVERVIANYHTAGLAAYPRECYVMVEGMPEFVQGEVYSGMMAGFTQAFGSEIATDGSLPTATVAREGQVEMAGLTFTFYGGSKSDFPASSILIGGKVYYLHFAPAAGAHMSPLQVTGRQAVDAYLAELEHAKATGAEAFIGGHGAGIADITAVEFQIAYLQTVKALMNEKQTADEFAEALKAAYPEAVLTDYVSGLASNLYQ